MLLFSKLFTCNLEKHDFKERIHTANKLSSQSDQSQCLSDSQSWDFSSHWPLTNHYFECWASGVGTGNFLVNITLQATELLYSQNINGNLHESACKTKKSSLKEELHEKQLGICFSITLCICNSLAETRTT